jgi:hypothetical protein
VKLLAGVAFLLVAWTAEAVAVGVLTNVPGGVATFAAAITCGYVALRFEELAREAREAWHPLLLRSFHRETADRLIERRRALAEAVADALQDEKS